MPPAPLGSSWPSRTQVLSPKRYILDRTQGGIRKDNNFEADDQNNFYIRFTLKRARSITRMREQSILSVVRLTLYMFTDSQAQSLFQHDRAVGGTNALKDIVRSVCSEFGSRVRSSDKLNTLFYRPETLISKLKKRLFKLTLGKNCLTDAILRRKNLTIYTFYPNV